MCPLALSLDLGVVKVRKDIEKFENNTVRPPKAVLHEVFAAATALARILSIVLKLKEKAEKTN